MFEKFKTSGLLQSRYVFVYQCDLVAIYTIYSLNVYCRKINSLTVMKKNNKIIKSDCKRIRTTLYKTSPIYFAREITTNAVI